MSSRDRNTAFTAFFEAEGKRLQRFASFMCGDPDLAADLTQEALLRTYGAWRSIRGAEPGPFARRIVVNALRDKQRRDRVRRLRPIASLPEVDPADPSASLDWLVVAALLRTLPAIRRAVVILRFYEDMTEQQIADALDRPLGTVKSDLHRALAALRPLLQAEHSADAKGSA
ncbi:MAG TPA: SigE family RNA polymerase sigma factor [Actinomycetota bacterium]|jgi:RNA polymerase sigma-70 factor (sigma-E family)